MPIPERPSLAIAFLTDYGTRDAFTGVCRAVINRLAPGAIVIDLTHQVTPGDIRQGALVLDAATAHTGPVVNLAVVDPGVGTAHRAVAVAAGEQFFVGPDNGLLWPAIQRAGGASEAVEISDTPVRLRPTGHTFHGRDLFSPVAAAIAAGIGLAELGEPFDPSELLARVEALLRRVKKEGRTQVRTFEFDDVQVDFESGEVTRAGAPVAMAAKELQLLRYLVDRRGKVVTREELLQNVWEYQSDVSSRTIDVHVAWLRQKLEENQQNPKHIHTIRGKGYRFA